MRRGALAIAAVCATGAIAAADRAPERDESLEDRQQMVLLDATAKLGDKAQFDKLRLALDSRGILRQLPEGLQATLEGRNLQIDDDEAIKAAYVNLEFDAALKRVEDNEARILQAAGGGDPIPALVQLSAWRGLIAFGLEQPAEAEQWFRTALRLDPAWTLDKKYAVSKVNRILKKARKESEETGKLRVDADPDGAMVQIDGGKAVPATERLVLPVGHHLVVVSADNRTTFAELVTIEPGKTERLSISLDQETSSDRAARLVDATVTAPPGKARLKNVKRLSGLTKTTRYLIVEDTTDDKLTVRVYDVDAKKVSRPLDVASSASSTAIYRKVMAALDPDNMVEPTSIMVIEKQRSQRWYERWYVWVGVGAVLGGGILGYQYATREPTTIRGF
ncbi:MAG: PEGA domain-containing protein [Kofleriaceae bacterium]